MLSLRYAELVYYGLWFTPQREALDAYFTAAQQRVTAQLASSSTRATLRLQSAPRRIRCIARPRELRHDRLQPKDAEGFINLFALPVTIPEQAKGAKAR